MKNRKLIGFNIQQDEELCATIAEADDVGLHNLAGLWQKGVGIKCDLRLHSMTFKYHYITVKHNYIFCK